MNKQELNNLLIEMKQKWVIKPPVGTREYYHYRSDVSKYLLKVKEFENLGKNISVIDLSHNQLEEIFK